MRDGVPLDTGSVDFVYHSHFMEHLSRPDAIGLMHECARLTRPGGVLRVVVPDHEYNVRLYLAALEQVVAEDSRANRDRYEWSVLNMFDQMVRVESGGQMARYWGRRDLSEWDYVVSTTGGVEANEIREKLLGPQPAYASPLQRAWRDPKRALRAVSNRLLQLAQRARYGTWADVFRPVLTGELHRWAWDRYSIKNALEEAGFTSVRVLDATTSEIPGFVDDNLDTDASGRPRKPNSLYVEAVRRNW